MAQLVLGVAGAALGGAVGGVWGARIGFAVGSYIGGSLEASRQNTNGPRLTDLKVVGSAYGTPIPWLRGSPRIAGQIWWSSDRREIASTQSAGKGGGPTVTTFSYEVDLLIGLADCADGEIAAVTRVWWNGKLVYTNLGTSDSNSLADSDQSDLWRRMSVYTGGTSQLPDPVYEAAVGTTDAPGYRGRAVVFFEGLQLGNSGQLPNLTFETCSHTLPGGTSTNSLMASVAADQTAGSIESGFDAPSVDQYGDVRFYAYGQSGSNVVRVRSIKVTSEGVESTEGTVTIGPRTDSTGRGNTDVLSGLKYAAANTYRLYSGVGASTVDCVTPVSIGLGPCWSRRGDYVYLAEQAVYTASKIYKFSTVSGALIGQSATLPYPIQYMAAGDDYIYCIQSGDPANVASTDLIYKVDATTLSLVETISSPFTPTRKAAGGVHVNSRNELFYTLGEIATPDWYKRVSGAWVLVSADTGLTNSGNFAGTTSNTARKTCLVNDTYYVVRYNATAKTYEIYRSNATYTPAAVGVDDVVSALCERAGMSASQIDVTDLAGAASDVRALVVAQVGPTRPVIEQLQTAYFFDVSLSDTLRFRLRAAAAAGTIPFEDLAAGTDGPADQPLALTIGSDLELPAQVAVQYRNMSEDQLDGTEYSDRIISGQATLQTVQLALGLTPAEAKGIADAIVADSLASLTTTTLSLPMAYAKYEPGDVVTVIDEDEVSTYRLRLTRKTEQAGVLTFDAVVDDAKVVVSAQVTDTSYTASGTVRNAAPTDWLALDIPLLQDVDNSSGYYVAARGETESWPGATILESADNVTFATAATVDESAVLGTCTTTLGNWTGAPVMDELNSVTVTLAHGELSSTTRDTLLLDNTVNVMLIGSEVIRFVTAALQSADPNVYKLTRLLRGQRGTEWAMTGHAASERAVLLRPQGLRRVAQDASARNQLRYVKGVSNGKLAADVIADSFTNTGISQMPFAPVDMRASNGADGNIVMTWKRRSRLFSSFCGASGINVPLGEVSERYDVEIYAAGYVTLKRTFSGVTSASVSYSFAQQYADFGAAQTTVYARIYQISSDGARGYVLQASGAVAAAAGATLNPMMFAGSASGWLANTTRRESSGIPGIINDRAVVSFWKAALPGGPYSIVQTASSDMNEPLPPFFVPVLGQIAQAGSYVLQLQFVTEGLSAPVFTRALLDLSAAPEIVTSSISFVNPRFIVGDSSRFLLFGESNRVYESTDGQAWSLIGTMAGATFPYLIGSANYTSGAVVKINSRFFLIFSVDGAVLATNDRLFYSDDSDAQTGWTACTGLSISSVEHLFNDIAYDGANHYAAVINIANGKSTIYASADGGASWSSEYVADLTTGYEVTTSGTNSAWVVAWQVTGTTGSDYVRAYMANGVVHEKLVGTTTWSAKSSALVNPFYFATYGGATVCSDNGARYSSNGSVIRSETAGVFAAVTGF